MLALGLRYLNGWAMAASDGARKEIAEWPPHPDRVFMALAAAWFETGADAKEGTALRWLEAQPPPTIAATDAEPRHVLDGGHLPVHYVPANDARVGRKAPPDGAELQALQRAGLRVLPTYRKRSPRHFPVAVPFDPTVYLVWAQEVGQQVQDALRSLTAKLTHVGHSASMVQAWVEQNPPAPTWHPHLGPAELSLRVSTSGRLDTLAAYHARGARPEPARWQGYTRVEARAEPEVRGTVFDPHLLVLTLAGRPVSTEYTLRLTKALRGAVLQAATREGAEPAPEWLGGHRPDGRPSAEPHLALLPLPFVGALHADGRVLGMALALPRGLDPYEAAHWLSPLLRDPVTGRPRTTRLFDGRWLACDLALEVRESPPLNLRAATWTRPSRLWASVTPVVLDRHATGAEREARAHEAVAMACERIGLPPPTEVILHPVSLVKGTPHARDFPGLRRKGDGGRRWHTHAILRFDELVRGPLAIGAGRFRGYGMLRPLAEEA